MKIIKSYFDDKVKLVSPTIHKDKRGFFSETYNKYSLQKINIKNNFIQDNYSQSNKKFTFRGIHLQIKPYSQAKIISVLSGSIIDYVVDLRKQSKTFGQSISLVLSSENLDFIYIPEGFGHGVLTLSNKTTIKYKVSNIYSKKSSISIHPFDDDLNLNFKRYNKKKFILSKNDNNGISLSNFKINKFK